MSLTTRSVVTAVAKALALLLLVSFATFMLLELVPGDVIDGIVPEGASQEVRDEARALYGLDRPVLERYADWVGDILRGDFGRSFRTRQPITDLIVERLPVSMELAALAVLTALVISVPTAVWSAYRPGGWVDRVATIVSSAALATPSFVLGVLLAFFFAVNLGVLPLLGYVPLSENPVDHFRYLVLPVLTLASFECVLFIRLLRADMIATLQQDHVLSARARGIPTWSILVRHSLRQSSFSLITVSGVVLGRLIGGTVIAEAIFSVPGMGTLVINAINSRDFLVVQAVVLVSAVTYMAMNALVDLTYPLLDPRVRRAKA